MIGSVGRVVRELRARKLRSSVADEGEFYRRDRTDEEIRRTQLGLLNRQWARVRSRVPFWAELARSEGLPRRFDGLEHFRESIPISTRKLVQAHKARMTNASKPADHTRTTGGSTGEPVQLPAWKEELEYGRRAVWYARSWYDVDPADRLFLIWGHRHLLGRGPSGRVNEFKRRMLDRLLGYRRFSAYDLSREKLREAGEQLLRFEPAYVMAYSGALLRFAEANIDRAPEFADLELKAVVATTESYPRGDAPDVIGDVLGAPVVMEYGAIETGLLAHEHPEGGFWVPWRNHLLEAVESPDVPGAWRLYVTSLYPRAFPLLRYAIGDLVSGIEDGLEACTGFDRVAGRTDDCVVLENGSVVHPQAFRDVISSCDRILDFQVVQSAAASSTNEETRVRVDYVASEPLTEKQTTELMRRFERVNDLLARVSLRRVPEMSRTRAAKTRRVIRERE